MPTLATLTISADVGIGELRFQRAQHALGGALGNGEPLYDVIQRDACMARRHQGGQCQQLLGLPERHGLRPRMGHRGFKFDHSALPQVGARRK